MKTIVAFSTVCEMRSATSQAPAAEIPAAVKKESWSTLGVNVENDFDPLYVVPAEKKKLVTDLKDCLKNVKELILATDEDREGESIGWHLVQVLKMVKLFIQICRV